MGLLENNVYLIGDGSATFVVDPTCNAPAILEALGERKLAAIVLTHHHSDHMGAAAALREATGATVIASCLLYTSVDDRVIDETARDNLFVDDQRNLRCV